MNNLDFSRELIKGKIAEIVFEQMFRETEEFTIKHFGYEYSSPELAQYHRLLKVPEVLDNVRQQPDFVLMSHDNTKVFMVEVKYRKEIHPEKIKEIAEKLLNHWHSPWLFVATPHGFFFQDCHTIVRNDGHIHSLSNTWVSETIQNGYLKLLDQFELSKSA